MTSKSTASATSLLRPRDGSEDARRVSPVELFFDLVFVFAITQLSHALLHDLSMWGALRTLLLMMAVWWFWIYTCWITNWLDPEKIPVRLLLFAMMVVGLLMSTSIGKAFDPRGLVFALAYTALQIGRTVFFLVAARSEKPQFDNFVRILIWFALSGVFWIAGGFAEGSARFTLWLIALAIEYVSPALAFWVPGLGRSSTADWNVEGKHIAERCGLFVIIALGESILVTGATFAGIEWTAATLTGFLVSLLSSIAMWWIYFNVGAEAGEERITEASDPGRLARSAYTYQHLLIVAGIIVTAAGDEIVLAHPGGHSDASTIGILIGGPALYLAGMTIFKATIAGRLPLSHLVGLVLLALVVPAARQLTPLQLCTAATAALIIAAVWEIFGTPQRAGHHGEATKEIA